MLLFQQTLRFESDAETTEIISHFEDNEDVYNEAIDAGTHDFSDASPCGSAEGLCSTSSTGKRNKLTNSKKTKKTKKKRFFNLNADGEDSDNEELVCCDDDSDPEVEDERPQGTDYNEGITMVYEERDLINSLPRNGNRHASHSDGLPDPSIILKSIQLNVGKGEVVAVIGRTGSGKTSLLNAILAEVSKVRGVVAVADLHHGFGYAAQQPWLQNTTVRENILFGTPYDEARYTQV